MLFIYSLYVIVVSPATAEGDDGRAAPLLSAIIVASGSNASSANAESAVF